MIFRKTIKNALEKLIGKDFRNSQIKQHQSDVKNAFLLVNNKFEDGDQIVFPSKKLYKRSHNASVSSIYYNLINNDQILFMYYMLFALIVFSFFSLMAFDNLSITAMIATGLFIATIEFIGAFFVEKTIALKRIKNENYDQKCVDELNRHKKGFVLSESSIAFIDLSRGFSIYNVDNIPYENISNVFVLSEDQKIEKLSGTDRNDNFKTKIIPPVEVENDDFSKLVIMTKTGQQYEFLSPSGPNGENANQIAEIIKQKKSHLMQGTPMSMSNYMNISERIAV